MVFSPYIFAAVSDKLEIWNSLLTKPQILIHSPRMLYIATARHGLSVEAACTSVSKDLLDVFNFALVWGRSTKFNPQRVGLSHVLMDEDVFQVVPKTLVQQKQSKDYRQKVIRSCRVCTFDCTIDATSEVLAYPFCSLTRTEPHHHRWTVTT
jgi:TGS domain